MNKFIPVLLFTVSVLLIICSVSKGEMQVQKALRDSPSKSVKGEIFLQKALTSSPNKGAQDNEPDCNGYGSLAKEAYDTHRWWETADATPATKKEDRKLDEFVKNDCSNSTSRREQKAQYARYYRNVIAPCKAVGQRWANCAVAQCESTYGTGGSSIYGFKDYWSAISVLPVRGNKTGTRFAPSSFSATKLEQDVVAAAAFKYGPTPSTCAS